MQIIVQIAIYKNKTEFYLKIHVYAKMVILNLIVIVFNV